MKEEFMKDMNEFVVANMSAMRSFIDNISVCPRTHTHARIEKISKSESWRKFHYDTTDIRC